jgi:hypothetical protein
MNPSLSTKYRFDSEAESKENHWVWDPMPELTITSPYVYFRVDFNLFTMGNPMSESTLTLCQSRLYPPVRDYGFGLRCFSDNIFSQNLLDRTAFALLIICGKLIFCCCCLGMMPFLRVTEVPENKRVGSKSVTFRLDPKLVALHC